LAEESPEHKYTDEKHWISYNKMWRLGESEMERKFFSTREIKIKLDY